MTAWEVSAAYIVTTVPCESPYQRAMTSLLRVGLILVVVTFVMLLVQDVDADDEVKRKRVIIKVPHRIKHIYHHHTKKVHIHKKKPKPKKKKPHKHVHVVVEEEEIVHPSWSNIKNTYTGKEGWDGWKAPSGFKHSEELSETKHVEGEFGFDEEQETRESRDYGRENGYRGSAGRHRHRSVKGKKKGGRSNSSASFVEPSFEASYEIHHHHLEPDDNEGEKGGAKGKTKSSSSLSTVHRGHSRRPFYRSHSRQSQHEKRRSKESYPNRYEAADEYDELYDRGPAYPERKEDPSWHQPRSRRQRDHRNRYHDSNDDAEQNHTQRDNILTRGIGGNSLWTLPKVPEVNEYIDDNDAPGPGVRPGWSGGFVPITTYTASVVQNSPAPTPMPQYSTIVEDYKRSPAAIFTQTENADAKPRKNPGYLSQVSQTPEGMTVSYRSHIGHSSNDESPSSSYQSVSYGSKLLEG